MVENIKPRWFGPVLAGCLFFISGAYIYGSNDGSHFALVSTAVENVSFELRQFEPYTMGVDRARKNGLVYSDRVVGLALLSLPFYLTGKLVESIGLAPMLSQASNVKEVFVLFLPNLAGVLSLVLLFRLFRRLGQGELPATIACALFAVSTPLWRESARFYSHAVSLAIVLAAMLLLIDIQRFDRAHARRIYGLSALLALGSIVELQNVLFVGPAGLYLLLSGRLRWRDLRTGQFWRVAGVGLFVFALVYAILPAYNYAAFGELMLRANAYNPTFGYEHSIISSLSNPWLLGVLELTFSNPKCWFTLTVCTGNWTPGFLVLCPIFLLALVSLRRFFRDRPNEALLFGLLIFIEFTISGKHENVHVRYITAVLPYLFFPVVYFVTDALRDWREQRGPRRFLRAGLVFALGAISAVRVYFAIHQDPGRSLAEPFPMIQEIPVLLAFSLIVSGIFWLAQKVRFRTRGTSPSPQGETGGIQLTDQQIENRLQAFTRERPFLESAADPVAHGHTIIRQRGALVNRQESDRA